VPGAKARYCDPSTDECCVTQGGFGTAPTSRCVNAQNGNCNDLEIPCDDTAECGGGDLCCATFDTGSNTYTSVDCMGQCDPNQQQYELCNPAAVPDECAANGMICTASTVLTGYYLCQ
jgi:hypothetical protein